MNRYSTTKLTVLAGAALAFEITVLDTFSFRGARAEVLLALACFAALFARDSRQGLAAAWIAGLVKDLGSAGPLGLHALLFLAAGWVVLQVRQVLFREAPLTQLTVAFVATCWVNTASALFVSATSGGIPPMVILGKTLLAALLTAAATPVMLFLFRRWKWLVT
jgi:rod shape-determining protein MreD